MSKLFFLNEFETRAFLHEFKDRNIICLIPLSGDSKTVHYIVFFNMYGFISTCNLRYSCILTKSTKPVFSEFLKYSKEEIEDNLTKLNKYVCPIESVNKHIITPFSTSLSSIITSQFFNASYCGAVDNSSNKLIANNNDIRQLCKIMLYDEIPPKEIFLRMTQDNYIGQKVLADFLDNHPLKYNGAFFAK